MTKKLQNSRRYLHAVQGIVVIFVIFKTAVNTASMENFFSEKKRLHFVPKSYKARLSIKKSKNLRLSIKVLTAIN